MFRYGSWDQSHSKMFGCCLLINGSGTFLALTRYISFKKRLKKAFLLFVCKFKKANPEMSAGNVEAAIAALFHAMRMCVCTHLPKKTKDNTLLFSMWTTLPACHCLVCQQRCVWFFPTSTKNYFEKRKSEYVLYTKVNIKPSQCQPLVK